MVQFRVWRDRSTSGSADEASGLKTDAERHRAIQTSSEVVTEWELDSHLAEGWKYIATLPSGRIIVEN